MQDIVETIKEQLATHPILIYMKGTPTSPQCGFSQKASQILINSNYDFGFIDILEFPEIRANLPKVSDWPTFPQIFVNGELLGGCDILVELDETGELSEILEKATK